MSEIRSGRRKYYDIFSHVYDAFIRLHARRDEGGTRDALVETADLGGTSRPHILDICCGTGAVILSFAGRYPNSFSVGYDFSLGMLRKAKAKHGADHVIFIEGDAALLPFADETFDLVTCSHALYELKGPARKASLKEMRRVVRPAGKVLIMEHELPGNPFVRMLFGLRMMAMGAADAKDFVLGGVVPFEMVFEHVSLTHSSSGKSKIFICRKKGPSSE